MSKFSAFMAQNVIQVENKKIAVSNRFIERDAEGNPVLDKKGKTIPILWEIKAISSEVNDELRRKSTVSVPVAGRRGMTTRELDDVKYTSALLAASVVFPNLMDAELQDSYGVKTPEALLKKMLLPHEEAKLAQEVTSFSEIEDYESLVEEAKN